MSDRDAGEIYILKYFTFGLGAMTYTATSISSNKKQVQHLSAATLQLCVHVLVQFFLGLNILFPLFQTH